MKNKLEDLNNILFEQLERLNDDEVCADKETTQREIDKADAMTQLAAQVLGIHQVELSALSLVAKSGAPVFIKDIPETILPNVKLQAIKNKYKTGIPTDAIADVADKLLIDKI